MSSEQLDKKQRAETQVRKILAEIASTEKAYAADLTALVTVYETPGQAALNKIGIADDVFAKAFSNVSALQQFHVQFAKEIEDILRSTENWKPHTELMCEAFCQHIGLMTAMYSTYSSKSLERQENLERLLKAKGWRDFAAAAGATPDIGSFLIKPIQRLTRYPLLFDQILKNIDESSPIKELVASTLEKVKKMADDCNADSRIRQNEALMKRFCERLEGFDPLSLGIIGNDIVFEREVIVSHGKSASRYKWHATLLTDYIVLSKSHKKDKLIFKALVRLDLATVQEINVQEYPDYFPFEIVVNDDSQERFVFYELSEVSRESWTKALRRRTQSTGLASSWRASRKAEFRKSMSVAKSDTPHPLMRSSAFAVSPREIAGGETTSLGSPSASSDAEGDTPRSPHDPLEGLKKAKRMSRMSLASSQIDIAQLRAMHAQDADDSPHFHLDVPRSRSTTGALDTKPKLTRGRSRSFSSDLNLLTKANQKAESLEESSSSDDNVVGLEDQPLTARPYKERLNETLQSRQKQQFQKRATQFSAHSTKCLKEQDVPVGSRSVAVPQPKSNSNSNSSDPLLGALFELYQLRACIMADKKEEALGLVSELITRLKRDDEKTQV